MWSKGNNCQETHPTDHRGREEKGDEMLVEEAFHLAFPSDEIFRGGIKDPRTTAEDQSWQSIDLRGLFSSR